MKLLKQTAAALALVPVMVGSALAEVPAEVTAAITDGTADGKTIAYGLLSFAVIIGVIMMIKRKAG
jgi:hypothetical protein